MIAAIVLAAGESKRFGRCKLLERIEGKTLLERALDAVRSSSVDEILVVLGAYADDIQREIRFDRERIVLNRDYASGMSTSIQAGLRATSADAALIALADQPFMTRDTIDRLIAEWTRRRPSAVVPMFDGRRGNPVVVDRSLFDEMMHARGDVGFREILERHRASVTRVDVDDRGVLIDVDEERDLKP